MFRPNHVCTVAVWLTGLSVFVLGCDQKRSPTEGTEARPIALAESPAAAEVAPVLGKAVLDGKTRAALSEQSRAAVDASRLPILVPRSQAGRGRLLVEEQWYDFAYRGEGTELHVKGLGVRHDGVPFPKANETIGGRAVFLNRSEGIVSASFEENGIHYDAYIECGGRACDDKAELKAFVADLVFVGGGVR